LIKVTFYGISTTLSVVKVLDVRIHAIAV